ncbi:MAG: NUDIX domain-containing protein [Conexivisphaerales archaeon]
MEKSAGGVVFYDAGGDGPVYLLMSNRKGYWEFPKGHVDAGETDEEAALREVREETGLINVKILPGFKVKIRYTYSKDGKKSPKEVTFFLMKAEPKQIEVSEEHTGYVWLRYDEAIKKISYENARKVLERAHRFLKQGKAD